MSESKNTLFGVDAEAAERTIIALISTGVTTQQAHEIFELCGPSIANKKIEPTDLENYIKFLEAAKVEYYKKENEHNTYVSSNLGGHIMELFFELDGSLE